MLNNYVPQSFPTNLASVLKQGTIQDTELIEDRPTSLDRITPTKNGFAQHVPYEFVI